ncbi:MAG: DUF6314 family protein [Planctomycetota bacterium]
MTVADAIARLAQASVVHSSAMDHNGRVLATSTGTVQVEAHAIGFMLYEHREVRTSTTTLDATDVSRWTVESDRVVVEHLRRGPDHPVRLAVFRSYDRLTATTVETHLCPPDVYIARLGLSDDGVDLTWNIQTPRGTETIANRYR